MSILDSIINAAITDIELHGFDSEIRVTRWIEEINRAAQADIGSDDEIWHKLRRVLDGKFNSLVPNLAREQKMPTWTIERIKPKLRAELDRRIMASANLIKLDRQAAIQKTLQRFSGWATSIPVGGGETGDKLHLKKSIKDLTYIERRVAIDQGHKLIANVREIAAVDNGALGMIWHSHWRRPGYQYREDHKDRDGVFYAVRDNWAMKDGLMKLGGHKYTDDQTKVGEEVYCSCYAQWIFNLNRLPDECLTEKGRAV